jgi:hypothetical protein
MMGLSLDKKRQKRHPVKRPRYRDEYVWNGKNPHVRSMVTNSMYRCYDENIDILKMIV